MLHALPGCGMPGLQLPGPPARSMCFLWTALAGGWLTGKRASPSPLVARCCRCCRRYKARDFLGEDPQPPFPDMSGSPPAKGQGPAPTAPSKQQFLITVDPGTLLPARPYS